MIDPHKQKQAQHVAINMTGGPSTGALDVDSSREEALYRFRDINWAAYTRYDRCISSIFLSSMNVSLVWAASLWERKRYQLSRRSNRSQSPEAKM